MTMVETTEEEAKMAVKPMLRLVSGGKGPPEVTGENWLINLQKNCVFSCKENGKEVDLELLRLVYKHGKTCIVADALNSAPARAVDPVAFCKRYRHFETIEEGGVHPEVSDNGNNPRTLRASRVGNDADAEGGQQTDG